MQLPFYSKKFNNPKNPTIMETSTVATPVASKVKSVTANGSFETQYGKFFSFKYEMEDGIVISANHKTEQGFFKVGEPVEYTIKKTNEYGNQGSVSKPTDPAFPSSSQSYKKQGGQTPTASFALSYAKDLVVAGKVEIGQILESATRLNNWLKENS